MVMRYKRKDFFPTTLLLFSFSLSIFFDVAFLLCHFSQTPRQAGGAALTLSSHAMRSKGAKNEREHVRPFCLPSLLPNEIHASNLLSTFQDMELDLWWKDDGKDPQKEKENERRLSGCQRRKMRITGIRISTR